MRCPSISCRPWNVSLLKVCFTLIPSIAVLVPTPARAGELTPESRVVAVTVYRDRALITREARTTLLDGEQRIALTDLPVVIDPDSVRVAASGTGAIEIDGLEVKQEFRAPELSPEHHRLQGELEDLTHRLNLLNDRLKSIVSLREFLGSLQATAGKESSSDLVTRGFSVQSWSKAFDFLSSRLDALSTEDRAQDATRKHLAEQIDVTSRKLQQIASQGSTRRWTVFVTVTSKSGGEAALRLTYLAGNASWTPLYDARLDPATGEVTISWDGQVTQSTGEDWKDVSLTLSTSRPAAGIDLPKLASLSLTLPQLEARLANTETQFGGEFIDSLPILGRDYQDVVKLEDGASTSIGAAAPSIHGARDTDVVAQQPAVAPASYPQAETERREVSVSFNLPGRLDIPSDNQPHKHRIASRRLPAVIEYHSVPRLVQGVYMAAKLTLPADLPLLPGKVQHFVGPDLVGSSVMADHGPGEEVTFSFGQDDRLRVERKELLRKVTHRGRDDEIDYHFTTTLENHVDRGVTVELKDRVPVSGDERFVVTLDERGSSSGFATDKKEPGIMTWSVSLPPGTKREVSLSYRVRLPRGLEPGGLD